MRKTKANVQKGFKEQMGYLIDIPKSGFGTSNDGSTVRKFFKTPQMTSTTGINEDLIYKIALILRVVSSGLKINITTWKQLTEQAKLLYLSNYGWYYMSVSMHKLLIHGSDILSHHQIPIGQLSEEALEATHKNIRYIREHYTRKSSRKNTNKDLINFLIKSSDPVVSRHRNKSSKVKRKIFAEIMHDVITNECTEESSLNFDEEPSEASLSTVSESEAE